MANLIDTAAAIVRAGGATGTVTVGTNDYKVSIATDGTLTSTAVDVTTLNGATVSVDGSVSGETYNVDTVSGISIDGLAAGTHTLYGGDTYATAYVFTTDASGNVTGGVTVIYDGESNPATANALAGAGTLYSDEGEGLDTTVSVASAMHGEHDLNAIEGDANSSGLHAEVTDGSAVITRNGENVATATTTAPATFDVTTNTYTATVEVNGTEYTLSFLGTSRTDTNQLGEGIEASINTTTGVVTVTNTAGTEIGDETVKFSSSDKVESVTFDLNNDGAIGDGETITFTNGETEAVEGITFGTNDAGKHIAITSTSTPATETAVTAGIVTSESKAEGTEVASTAYNGTAQATFTLPNGYSHELTFAYADGEVTSATDTYNGTTTRLTAESDGSYKLTDNNDAGLSVKLVAGALSDGALVASEVQVSTIFNSGSDITLADSTAAATTAEDGIKVDANSAGSLVYYKFDDTHYYAIPIDSKGKLVDFYDTATNGTDDTTINGITFNATKTLGFSTDGTNYSAVAATFDVDSGTITPGNDTTTTPQNVGTLSVKYVAGSQTLTITPGSSSTFTATGADVATITFATTSTGTYDGAEVTGSSNGRSNFTKTQGTFGISFTTPTYGEGVSAGGQTYAINFSNIGGYQSDTTTAYTGDGAAACWKGDITVTAGTNSPVTFTGVDFGAWLGDEAHIGTNSINVKTNDTYSGWTWGVGTNGSVVFTTSNTDTIWHTASSRLGTDVVGTSGALTYKFTTSATTYTGPVLTYKNGTLTYKSTNQLGTAIKESDQAITWNLTGNAITVTQAAAYDADDSTALAAVTDKGTITKGDEINGTLDYYTLSNGTKTWQLGSNSKTDLSKAANFLTQLGAIGKSQGATVSDVGSRSGIIDLSRDATTSTTSRSKETVDGVAIYNLNVTYTAAYSTDTAKVNSNGTWKSSGTTTIDDGAYLGNVHYTNVSQNGDGTLVLYDSTTTTDKVTYGAGAKTGYLLTGGLMVDTLSGAAYVRVNDTTNVANHYNDQGKLGRWTGFAVSTDTNLAKGFGYQTGSALSDITSKLATQFATNGGGVDSNIDSSKDGSGVETKGMTWLPSSIATSENVTSAWIGLTQLSTASDAESIIRKGDNVAFAIDSDGSGTAGDSANEWHIAAVMGTGSTYNSEVKAVYSYSGGNGTWTGSQTTTVFASDYGYIVGYDTSTSKVFAAEAIYAPLIAPAEGGEVWRRAFGSSDTKVYHNISLGTQNGSKVRYAIAVSDNTVIAAAYDWDGESGSANAYTDVTVSKGGIFSETTTSASADNKGLAYAFDSDTNSLKVVGGDGTFTVDLSDQSVGFNGMNVTLADGKLKSFAFVDSSGEQFASSEISITFATKADTSAKVDGTSDEVVNVSGDAASYYWSDVTSITATNDKGGTTAAILGNTGNAFAEANSGITFGASDGVVSGTVTAAALTDLATLAKSDAYNSKGVSGTLADLTLEDGARIISINLGSATFYLVGTLATTADASGGFAFTPTAVYNAAGTEADEGQGLFLDGTTLKLSDGTGKVEAGIVYTAADTSAGTAAKYTLKATSDLNKLKTVIRVDDLTKAEISEVTENIFQAAELIGADDWAQLGSAASATPTSKTTAQSRVVATYLTTQFTSADYAAAIAGGAAGVDYTIATADGGYTGVLALGHSNAGNDNTNGYLLKANGTYEDDLYATYTFGSDKTFELTGLYGSADLTSEATGFYLGEDGKSILSSDTTNTITYNLTAASQSEVTVALSADSTIIYDNTNINMTIGEGTADTSEGVTAAFKTQLNFTTINNGTASIDAYDVTFSVAADSSITATAALVDSTGTGTELALTDAGDGTYTFTTGNQTYAFTYSDVNGDGKVDTGDTVVIAMTDTSNADATAGVTANVKLTIDGNESDVELSATAIGTNVTTKVNGETVDLSAEYSFELKDTDNSGTANAGDVFEYASKAGDTIEGSVIGSTETGTLSDGATARIITTYANGAATTSVGSSDTTATSGFDGTFTYGDTTYTVNSDGTITKKSSTITADATTDSSTTTYTVTLSTDATTGTVTLSNAAGDTSSTVVTITSQRYINLVDATGAATGETAYLDDLFDLTTEPESGEYTAEQDGVTYTWDGTSTTVSVTAEAERTAYEVTTGESSLTLVSTASGNALTGGQYTAVVTYTTAGTIASETFTVRTAEALAEAIQEWAEDAGVDLDDDNTTITVSGSGSVGSTTISASPDTYQVKDSSGNVVGTVVNNAVSILGRSVTFSSDMASVTSAGATLVGSGDGASLILGDGDSTLAQRTNSLSPWTISGGVTDITNSSGDDLVFIASDGDNGVLSNGDKWDITNNKLTSSYSHESIVEDETGKAVHLSDGVVTGIDTAKTLALYSLDDLADNIANNANVGDNIDDTGIDSIEGAAYVLGVGSTTSVEGVAVDLKGDNDYDIAIVDGKVVALGDVSTGATIGAGLSGTDITTDETGAVVAVEDGFTGTVNDAEIAVDGEGISLQATSDDSIDAVTGIGDGDAVTVSPSAGVAFNTEGNTNGDPIDFTINGREYTQSGDEDGVTIRDGVVSDLDEGAVLGGSGTVTVAGEAFELNDDQSIVGAANGTATTYSGDNLLEDAMADESVFGGEASQAELETAMATVGGNAGILSDGVIYANEATSLASALGNKRSLTITDALLTSLGGSGGSYTINLDDRAWQVIDESSANLIINGGAGNDEIRISSKARGNKVVSGGSGNDKLLSNLATVTLSGGAGAGDSLVATNGNVVNLLGTETVTLRGDTTATTLQAASNANGTSTVKGFDAGFEDTADVFVASGLDLSKTSFTENTNGGKTVKVGGTNLSVNFTDLNGTEEAKVNNQNVVLVTSGETYDISGNLGVVDVVLGEGNTGNNNTKVMTNEGVLDMSGNWGTSSPAFRNIAGIAGGSGRTTLIGADTESHSFYAGSGETMILTGQKADTVYGYEGNDRTGGMRYLAWDGRGTDTIVDFHFANSSDGIGDTVEGSFGVGATSVVGGDVRVYAEGADQSGSNYAIVKDGMGKTVDLMNGVNEQNINLGSNLNYDEQAHFYGNFASENNTLNVGAGSMSQMTTIDLNNDVTNDFAKYWNVNHVNASAADQDIAIYGSKQNDLLMGGTTNSSLWGGDGNDTLIGGSGQNTYYYFLDGVNDGDDQIQVTNNSDVIYLVGDSLEWGDYLDDASQNGANKMTFKSSNHGGTLTVTARTGSGVDLTNITVNVGSLGGVKVNSTGGFRGAND